MLHDLVDSLLYCKANGVYYSSEIVCVNFFVVKHAHNIISYQELPYHACCKKFKKIIHPFSCLVNWVRTVTWIDIPNQPNIDYRMWKRAVLRLACVDAHWGELWDWDGWRERRSSFLPFPFHSPSSFPAQASHPPSGPLRRLCYGLFKHFS